MDAPDKVLKIKGCITAVIAIGTSLWGATGWVILLFLACIFLDYITGSFAAIRKGEWSSSIARQGLWHKLGEIFALLVAALCDIAVKVILTGTEAGILAGIELPGTAFTLLVSVWYIFTELGSITENAARMGAPVPEFLIRALEKLRQETAGKDEEKLPIIMGEIAEERMEKEK